MPVKKRKSKILGKGFIDSISNKVFTSAKHQIIHLSDGTYNSARYSGPGTNLSTRIKEVINLYLMLIRLLRLMI